MPDEQEYEEEIAEQDDLAAMRYLADTLAFVESEVNMMLEEYRQRELK